MTPTNRPRPEPIRFRTYACKQCRRMVQYAPGQELPNYHRDKSGKAWCVAPPSCSQVTSEKAIQP